MAAEMKVLNEVTDVSIDEDLHLDYKDVGEFSSIAKVNILNVVHNKNDCLTNKLILNYRRQIPGMTGNHFKPGSHLRHNDITGRSRKRKKSALF